MTITYEDGSTYIRRGTFAIVTQLIAAGGEMLEGLKDVTFTAHEPVPADRLGVTGTVTIDGEQWRMFTTNLTKFVNSAN